MKIGLVGFPGSGKEHIERLMRLALALTAALTATAIAAPPAPVKHEVLKRFENLSAEITPKGKIEHGYRWTDRNGTNYLLVGLRDSSGADTRSRYLDVIHGVCDGDGKCRQLRRMRDLVEKCELDIILSLEPGSVTVTDLDGNGLAEVTLLYRLDCRGDVGANSLKLMVLENGQKFAIRGSEKVTFGIESDGGEMKLDPEFSKAPATFLQHALMIWARYSHRKM